MEKGRSLLKAYITTALWSSLDNDGTPLDSKYTIDNINHEDIERLNNELNAFVREGLPLLTEKEKNNDKDLSTFVHNFWLTRNGHGAGFWDGDYKNGNTLTELSEKYGPMCLYVGDDGLIFSSP